MAISIGWWWLKRALNIGCAGINSTVWIWMRDLGSWLIEWIMESDVEIKQIMYEHTGTGGPHSRSPADKLMHAECINNKKIYWFFVFISFTYRFSVFEWRLGFLLRPQTQIHREKIFIAAGIFPTHYKAGELRFVGLFAFIKYLRHLSPFGCQLQRNWKPIRWRCVSCLCVRHTYSLQVAQPRT